jgi:hypothetical protein
MRGGDYNATKDQPVPLAFKDEAFEKSPIEHRDALMHKVNAFSK